MTIENLEQLKAMLQKVLESEGFTAFCKDCPMDRCCVRMKPTCDYVINKMDCCENKPLECHFYICPILNEKNKQVSNWLMRVRQSVTWPNKLEFPIEIEDFPDKFRIKEQQNG